MSKYKAGESIELYEFLAGTNSVFYNSALHKAMHYEALASLPLRIVFNWVKEGIIREAIPMSKEEIKEDNRIKRLKRKTRIKRKSFTNTNGLIASYDFTRSNGATIPNVILGDCNPEVDVEFEDY